MKERHTEKVLKALANRRRIAILCFLKAEREGAVGDIASAIRLSFKATSKHLVILASADVVDRTQQSLNAYYHLSSDQHPISKTLISIL